jgi:hypothetical protein
LLYKIKDKEENADYDQYGRPNKKVKLKLDDIYEPIAIGVSLAFILSFVEYESFCKVFRVAFRAFAW